MKFPPFPGFLIFIGLMAAPFGLRAQTSIPVSTSASDTTHIGARMTFVTKEYNFGKVAMGEKVRYAFILTNTGDQTLVISQVVPGCHCTTIGDWSKAHSIQPGERGEIPFVFDSGGLRGTVHRTIRVTSNDKIAPVQTLTLMGTIWRPVEVVPQFANIMVMPDAISNSSTIVRITNDGETPLTLSNVASANRSFKGDLKTIIPGKEYELTVTAVPPLVAGNTVGSISIKTSLSNMPVIQVTAIASMQPSVRVSPLQMVVPQMDRMMTNYVTIMDNQKKPLNLSDLEASDKRVNVSMKATQPGRIFQISAVFPPHYKIEPGHASQITVKSDNPQYRIIVVPINTYSMWPGAMNSRPVPHPRVMSQNPPSLQATGHP